MRTPNMTGRLPDPSFDRWSGPAMLPIGTLPGIKPNAPRRNLLIALAYLLAAGSLYWLVSTVVRLLGVAFEAVFHVSTQRSGPRSSLIAGE